MRIGCLFPGQGAQYVGMGRDFYDHFPAAKSLYDQADRSLGYSLSQICFEGPEEKLTRTLYAQPAIFVTSLAVMAAVKQKWADIDLAFAAGLSLGEFSALVACDSISFEDGLRLVQARAEAMENAAKNTNGTMASVMGLALAECESIAKEAGCEIANLNAPDQTVISGAVESIEKACRMAEDRGAKRALRLKVGGAFHSSLMESAKAQLTQALTNTPIRAPQCVFIPNVTARKVTGPDEIRELLARQLISPVRWVETMEQAAKENILFYLEAGPGKVLKGLARKSIPELTVEPCGTIKDLKDLEQKMGGVNCSR